MIILGGFIKDIKNFPRNYVAQLPTIFFFIILFILIVSFFGAGYAIMVSAFTTVFKVKNNKNLSIYELFKLFVLEALLCFLGIIASYNIFLCIFLNIFVLFIFMITGIKLKFKYIFSLCVFSLFIYVVISYFSAFRFDMQEFSLDTIRDGCERYLCA